MACIVRLKPDGTRWRVGGEMKGKLANGVGSHYSHTPSERGVSSITTADAHNSAASSRLNWRPRRFKWTRPFRRKTKSGYCACAIAFQTRYTVDRQEFTARTSASVTSLLASHFSFLSSQAVLWFTWWFVGVLQSKLECDPRLVHEKIVVGKVALRGT